MDLPPKAKEITAKISKWDIIKHFCTAKEPQIILSKKGYVLMHITGKKRDEWVLGITVHRFSKMGEDSNSGLDFPLSVATFFPHHT